MKAKPCSKCPWISKDPELIALVSEKPTADCMKRGEIFTCHVNMGTCFGALFRSRLHARQISRVENKGSSS